MHFQLNNNYQHK